MNRPIGIYEWCALTREMLEQVYPEDLFTAEWLNRLRGCHLNITALLAPDAIERGEELLKEDA